MVNGFQLVVKWLPVGGGGGGVTFLFINKTKGNDVSIFLGPSIKEANKALNEIMIHYRNETKKLKTVKF